MALLLTLAPGGALAQAERWSLRSTASAALMVSSHQVERLKYDKPGLFTGLAAEYAPQPWLGLHAGLVGGPFWASQGESGGLLAASLGPAVRAPGKRAEPYASLELGGGLTGALVRPFFLLATGIDWRMTARSALGPVLGYGQLVQWNRPLHSMDARFFWFGLSLRNGLGPAPARPAPSHPRRAPLARVAPPAPRPETPPPPPPEPSPDVIALLERALPTPAQRIELLAPVLFAFDSDELEPIGVAMLHEVAHTLRMRPDIELVQIQGYADERGGSEYNRDLSQRRAERVRAWLIEHEVEPERLTIDAHGASGFIESGRDEAAHTQNRRVIFRVLEAAEP